MTRRAQLSLPAYYAVESLYSAASMLFLYGIYFWLQARHGFAYRENLWLGFAAGAGIAPAAYFGGRLADRAGYDAWLRALAPALPACVAALWLPARATAFVAVPLYLFVLSCSWPAVEAAVLHAPSPLSMPRRLGRYNLAWALSGAAMLFAGGPLYARHRDAVLVVPVALHVAACAGLWMRRRGAADGDGTAMDVPHRTRDVPRAVKRSFVRLAWIANGLCYLMQSALMPLLPWLAREFGLSPSRGLTLVSAFFVARGLSFVLFWKWEGWHYHRGWAAAAIFVAPLALGAVFFGGSLPGAVAAFAAMGVAFGLTYSASIYYSLDYGENKGEHGGIHEAVIGLGNVGGPLLGMLGARFLGGPDGGMATVLAAAALAGAAALAPLFRRTVGAV